MVSRNQYDGIDEYAVKLIRLKARQLVGKYGFTESDRDDLEQEMMFDLLSRLLRYDAKRAGRKTFITRIIENKVASIIEYQGAAKRDYRLCTCSLDDRLVNDESDASERIDTVDQDDYLIRTGRQSRPAAELRDLQINLAKIMALLHPDLRNLCELLMANRPSEVARALGVSRTTICRRLKRIRTVFEIVGGYSSRRSYSSTTFRYIDNQGLETQTGRNEHRPAASSERIDVTGGKRMNGSLVKYNFDSGLSMKEVEESLMLAVLAAECLHNRSAVMLDACFRFKAKEYSCIVDTTTPIGRDIAVLFTGLLCREFGESRFRVKRVAGVSKKVSQSDSATERKPADDLGDSDGH